MGLLTTVLFALSIFALIIYPVIRRFGRNAFYFAALGPGTAFVALLVAGLTAPELNERLTWVPELGLNLTLRMDQLSWLFSLLVSGAGALVLFYCRNYFSAKDEGLARFGSVFLAFCVSMLGLVLADDVYLLFIFWEATSVFSFLLIAHSFGGRTSRASALQALIVTTFGGLVMLVGLVMLSVQTGSSELSDILASPPTGPATTTAVFLTLVGALSKSAIFPFHFWLPGAMAAPTPVSAYLHAAAMVKAGIYLIARLDTAFASVPGYRETLVLLGALTMISGGLRALRQFDIKLIIAHGTVSQLGMLAMVLGVAEPEAQFVGIALLFAHALAKAPLFLIVGIIDHRAGTRDLRKLSRVGRQTPFVALLAILASLSMVGLPPMIGFISKEAALAELFTLGATDPMSVIAFAVMIVGSALTVAYMLRFLWGTFATKRGVAPTAELHRESPLIHLAPTAFVLCALAGGVFAPVTDALLQPVAASGAEHLALWHGFGVALWASVLIVIGGALIGVIAIRWSLIPPAWPDRLSASHIYWLLTHWVDVLAVRLTALTQRGSLPFYLVVILAVAVVSLGGTLLVSGSMPSEYDLISSPVQLPIALVIIVAAVFATRARTRFQAVVLVGVTGYGMAAIFALHGAPDLALTQALVETVTLIAFVLVIRRLPQHIGVRTTAGRRWIRALLGTGIGVVLGAFALAALAARSSAPISDYLPELAHLGGHGDNVVNVMLVDIRGWDTLGELSVILAAATGVASLVFVSTRVSNLPRLSRKQAHLRVQEHMRRIEDPNDPVQRRTWMLAGRNLDPSRRSILLEVVVRLLFHALILLSFYLLLTGHNSPGGGFAGGLVAGLALVARYLTGGREELGATVPVDAGRILGAGLALASTVAILPLFFGQAALASVWFDLNLGPLGTIPIVSSTFFDIGVYLVVFGLVLDVLRSLGAEVDKQEENESRRGVPSIDASGQVTP